MTDDKRLIEDYLPIVAISAEASREKSVRKGHISTLHLWWARRPLVACRAAVYGALVPASQFVPACADKAGRPNGGTDAQRKSLGRANAAKFITSLCQYPGSPQIIKEAQQHILKAHAERLSQETGKAVSVEDIVAGRAPRPRVLDMFAGGGAIPLEALRLGCEAYALDLNPVAHIIQLCTLVYPQKYGKPDPNARGMAGPKNDKGETTWGGLADEVRYWGNWVLEKVHAEIGDLYPLIPDPEHKGKKQDIQADYLKDHTSDDAPPGYLMPVAYFWTRTVNCNNPACGATVPLVKQTWLRKKEGGFVAMKMVAPRGKKETRFEVVEALTAAELGFDPEAFSKAGNATCLFCGTVADSDYVKAEGCAGRMGIQSMAVACSRPERSGKVYLAFANVPEAISGDDAIRKRIETLCNRAGLTVPDEPIVDDAKNSCWTPLYGFTTFGSLYNPRQMLALLTFTSVVRSLEKERFTTPDIKAAILTSLGVLVDRIASQSNTCSVYHSGRETIENSLGARCLPLTWDFVEANPLGTVTGSAANQIEWIASVYEKLSEVRIAAHVSRGSAMELPYADDLLDAVITDPPYYDNVPYANLSDFFYSWLKRSLGSLHGDHFAGMATPKKAEAVADALRHGGTKDGARRAYETMMAKSFQEAHRVLKPNGEMLVVYAHKTTLGWATLLDALRLAGFTVVEAWPLDTEMKAGKVKVGKAMLASSIFLVARKREGAEAGSFEEVVKPGLEQIVRERVETLWGMGISGADLVIACVGAGLRAFTRFARVEYANGEEVPAERFLTEVETVVLETILSRLSKEVGSACASHADRGKGLPAPASVGRQAGGQYSLASLDTASRFYVLWRYTYGAAELDAGEAIVFANGTHVELDGPHGLTTGSNALVEKKKGKYRLRDFNERGSNDKLGLPADTGQPAPLVDALQRTLWLMEKRPTELSRFLREAQPNREALRLVAQALAGPALKGGEMGDISPTAELSALAKLTANWQSVVEDAAQTTGEKEERKKGQKQLI